MAASCWISGSVLLLSFCLICNGQNTNYIIGSGIADITGPAAEVDMMGYANPGQTSKGIHLRQYSRAFIIADSANKSRVVFVSTDSCMQSQGLKLEIIKRLKNKYGDLYNERNVAISGTHTHSGPGGFHQYLLYDITSLGFVNETFLSLAAGIVASIEKAHNSMRPGNLYVNTGELMDSNINRSPTAYLNNPSEERAKYRYDVDKNMTVLRMIDAQNKGIGMINWFAVHCTSMNNTNHLISSDNKGLAAQMFEADLNGGAFPGKGEFVAAFAQSNEGDVSPNTKGPHCMDTGKPCDVPTSTCNGRNELCVSPGPGKDMFDSTRIIASNQYKKAKILYNDPAAMKLEGPVDFRHTYVDMSNVMVQINQTTKVKTCKPAMGFSFAAGTTDGPGAFNFTQGDTTENPFWDFIRDFLKKPSAEQQECQHPKPILLDTGEISSPYAWSPSIVDLQIFRIGQLAIISVPAEFSTMSGRRTRDSITATLKAAGLPANTLSVIAGLTNDYADYVTTYEEYQIQRYEGASTIYGPHTLEAFIQEFNKLAVALAKGTPAPPGPTPPNLMDRQLSFLPPVIFDHAPFGRSFGDIVTDANPQYKQGDSVQVVFIGANPRNDVKLEDTFLTVEMLQPDQSWKVVYTDSQWETKFEWKHTSLLLGESQVTITWDIPQNQAPGTYRVQYFGDSKSIDQKISKFTGKSTEFKVMTPKQYRKQKLEAPKKVNEVLKKNWNSLYKQKYSKNMFIVNKKH
ncbi:uncharacterized protein LOC133176834 [Saccostrea echinata]|uniref:uncharacterized protein LOC133176834 n=1 Tax=Saccostrea echinata TaxID=191078 RepID=UPI002A81C57B|nr:uncharacterized protein LOC133176834 [Saccostrea echinata]